MPKETSPLKIVLIWGRIGPYHEARLRGATEVLDGQRFSVVGLEVASRDGYDWSSPPTLDSPQRVTVFPGRDYNSLSRLRIGIGVTDALTRTGANVVAVNGWSAPEAIAAISWCVRNSIPCVLMSETKLDDTGRRRVWAKESLKSLIVQCCGAALVGGRKQAEYLASLGFPAEKIFLGYDVVDNEYFGRESRAVTLDAPGIRQTLGLPKRYFFACTRFLARKNVDGLLHSYAMYREARRNSTLDLVIAGSGDLGDDLRKLAQKLKLDSVTWPGFVQYEVLPKYYGLASCFVHPAATEAWGLVVNEAAASGLPLLVGNTVGSAYELVCEGENGWLFDARDKSSMCQALLNFSDLSDYECERMGARSREIVAEWCPERFGLGLAEAIDTALSCKRLAARNRGRTA